MAYSSHNPGTGLYGSGLPQTARQYTRCHGRDLNRVSLNTGLKKRHPHTDLFGFRKVQQKFYCGKSYYFKLQRAIINYSDTSKH